MKTKCCVPYCSASSRHHFLLNFYLFPKKSDKRRKWTKLIRSTLKKPKWETVCSLHFRDGKKSYDNDMPERFPWSEEWEDLIKMENEKILTWFKNQRNHDHDYSQQPTLLTYCKPKHCTIPCKRETKNSRNILQEFNQEPCCSKILKESAEIVETCAQSSSEKEINKTSEVETNNAKDDTILPMKIAYYPETHLLTRSDLQSLLSCIEDQLEKGGDVVTLTHLLQVVIKLLKNVQEQLDAVIELRELDKFSIRRFEGSDDDIRFWTGFPSYSSLMYFYNGFIVPNQSSMKYWGAQNANVTRDFKAGKSRQLPPIDELFLTLIKLKRASANEDLAERFNLSDKHVSSIIITWVNLMANAFQEIDIWLSKRKVKKLMPSIFKPIYSDVRIIVDCTEMVIERPSDFQIQSATYSTYKSRNTVKGLIGLSPTGIPTFVSNLMEGSVSDNDITFQSGLVLKLEKGDAIMADRGWTNKPQLSKHGIKLVVPHFLMDKKQFNIPELVESVSLARLRIHVERCIGRIKQWKILTNTIPLSYWNNINDIWHVCANLLLFWPPFIDK